MTFAGQTFGGLTIVPGTYVYNLTNGLDNITLIGVENWDAKNLATARV